MSEIEYTEEEQQLLKLAQQVAENHAHMPGREYEPWRNATLGRNAGKAYEEALAAVGRGEFDVSLLTGGVPASMIMGLHPNERAKLAPGRRIQVRTRDYHAKDWPYLTWREMTEGQRRQLFSKNLRYFKDEPNKNQGEVLPAHEQSLPSSGPSVIHRAVFGEAVRVSGLNNTQILLGEHNTRTRRQRYELDLIATRAKLRKDGSLEEVIRILQEGLL